MNTVDQNCICTVLLISYNHELSIKLAIESVLRQRTRYKYKVHIFDDASTDGTIGVIHDYVAKYPGIIVPFIAERPGKGYVGTLGGIRGRKKSGSEVCPGAG